MVSFIRKAAATQPLLIVLDDLHAADPTSLLLLIALIREIRNTLRDGDRHVARTRDEALGRTRRADCGGRARRRAIRAPRLRRKRYRPVHRAIVGVSVHGALVKLLLDTTEGNPFFLSEILRVMAAEGQLEGDISALPCKPRIPNGERESIKRSMAPLGKDTHDILSIASVIGCEFDLNCLEGAS
jgi:predicted ATPase